MPKLEQSFEVDAPVDRVWNALIDVEQVAPCLPGATITEANEEGVYEGTFSAKVGPASVSFKGTLKMDQVDEASHTATMLANGSNRRGQGGAKATIVSKVADNGSGGTKVDIDTDYSITGPLARLGRGGMIEDVGNRLLREFAACLNTRLAQDEQVAEQIAESAPPAEAAEAQDEAIAYRQTPDLENEQAPTASTAAAEPSQAPPAPKPAQPRPAQPAQPPKAAQLNVVQLLLGVLRDRLKRLFGRK